MLGYAIDDEGLNEGSFALVSANLRRWAAYDDNILAVIPRGARVEILRRGDAINNGKTEEWFLVRYQKQEGFILASLIDV